MWWSVPLAEGAILTAARRRTGSVNRGEPRSPFARTFCAGVRGGDRGFRAGVGAGDTSPRGRPTGSSAAARRDHHERLRSGRGHPCGGPRRVLRQPDRRRSDRLRTEQRVRLRADPPGRAVRHEHRRTRALLVLEHADPRVHRRDHGGKSRAPGSSHRFRRDHAARHHSGRGSDARLRSEVRDHGVADVRPRLLRFAYDGERREPGARRRGRYDCGELPRLRCSGGRGSRHGRRGRFREPARGARVAARQRESERRGRSKRT